MADYQIQVLYLNQLLKKCQNADSAVIGPPLRQMFDRIGFAVENEIKTRVPVDEGRLRSAMSPQVDTGAMPKWVKIGVLGGGDGTVATYGRVMEFGRAPGKFPPIAAIERWAARHGIRGKGAAFLIARAIAKRGIKGKGFMRRGYNAARDKHIEGFIHQAAREIGVRWQA
jgi:hypothetical protein